MIIIGSQWIGEKPYAYCVTEAEALQEILENRAEDLLEVFPELKLSVVARNLLMEA